MQRSNYTLQRGVYGGFVLICLRCKGCTYIPNRVMLEEYIYERARDHNHWCPALLEEALADLLGYVKPPGDSPGTVGTEGK